MDKRSQFLENIAAAADRQTMLKISLGKKRDPAAEIKNIYIKPAVIKEAVMLSFVYRYPSKDITKNYSPGQAVDVIEELLNNAFFNADLYTSGANIYFSVDSNGKEKLVIKPVEAAVAPVFTHDKQKQRIIDASANYLEALGITGAGGHVKKERQHKFRQINRYVEIIEGILKEEQLQKGFSIVDMGSGKGYLTFALYDYLRNKNINVNITGIELRKELVEKCNNIARQSKFDGLNFKEGSIGETEIKNVDMLIALHACDTATDDAIAKGIAAAAKIVICAPCCHKQIRKQMAPANAMKHITRHGILLERQAETVTDTIRALMLEAHGYKTKVFEFIDEADTPKNVLIVGVRSALSSDKKSESLEAVRLLKELFGIREHYLETLLS